MRILLITPYFYPHIGGSQQYAEDLYAHLMQQHKNIHVDVLCYNTDRKNAVEQYRGFTIYRIPCIEILPGQFAVPNYFSLWKTIRSLKKHHRYDLVNAHTRFFDSAWWTPIVASYLGVPAMLTDHCADHPTHSLFVISWLAKVIDHTLVRWTLKKYDVITVTNQATYRFLQTLGVSKPLLIYGGVNSQFFSRKTTKKRSIPGMKKQFGSSDVIVTFVGRIIPSKGPDLLFSVAKTLTTANKNIYFFFAGNGVLYKKLSRQQIPQITMLGPLKKPAVARLLAQTDILVHPSRHHEGFPNVLLEAGASGCAVIATNKGGTKEIIDEQTGILISPTTKAIQSALELLIEDKTKRARLAKALQQKIKKQFDWETIAATFYTTLPPLLSSYKKQQPVLAKEQSW